MNDEFKIILKKTKTYFPNSFINNKNELILEPENNLYFRLEEGDSVLDFKSKLLSWLSRPISKGLNEYWSESVLKSLNNLLETDLTKEDMRKIYTFLGFDENRALSIKFIKSNYNLSLFKN